jgi:Fe(II)/alpha-ketoglutarate-dependent arginine beta-hydroxylase
VTFPAADPIEHTLSPQDAERLINLADQLRLSYGSPDNPSLGLHTPTILREVPEDLALFLRAFHRDESAGAAVVRGLAVDEAELGPTPPGYDPAEPTQASVTLDFYLTLVAHCLGEPFAWSNLQGGRLVHNVLPVRGSETDKTGTSSLSTLELHTEDAAHPARADYLILLCLRNHDQVPTVYASLSQTNLEPGVIEVLAQPRFTMRVEADHAAALGESLRTAVLFGHPAGPYLAYDGYYLSAEDPVAQDTLDDLTARLEKAATDVLLRPGDLVILDNFQAVHGRRPFQPRYDGRDRWLKRIHVARDLRRSRQWRSSSGSPVIDVNTDNN